MKHVLGTMVFALTVGFAACSSSDDESSSGAAGSSGASGAGATGGGSNGGTGGGTNGGSSGTGGTNADASTSDASSSDSGADAAPTGSPGCGKSATPGVTDETITIDSDEREYILVIPDGYDPSSPLPLVFGWHGRTGSATNFRGGGSNYGGGVEKASAGQAIFVYPNGLPVSSDPNDTGWVIGNPNGRDFKLFDALVETISDQLCVDVDRIFSYGHSFGAYMSEALACHRANVIRGIGAVAGGPPPNASACPGTPVAAWLMNSTDDKTVLFDSQGVPARNYWIETNGCSEDQTTPVEPDPCVAYQGCTKPFHWCAPTDKGHSFPSFVHAGIWNFFAAQ